MNFLYPIYLWGLLLVVIPILVHLFNFRKFKRIGFTNVHFLKEIQLQNSSQQKLRNRLILCARILTLIALVLVFARPYFNQTSTDSYHNHVISVFLDNSQSMDMPGAEGILLNEAKRKAKEIAAAYQLNDQFQLLTNDFTGESQQLLSYDEFLEAVDKVKISSVSRDLTSVIARQKNVFYGKDNEQKLLYIISDFQKSFVGDKAIRVDASIQLRFVKIKANKLPNIAIDSVWFTSPIHTPGANEQLVVKVTNYSSEDVQNVPMKLVIDKEQKAVASISLAADESKLDTLNFTRLSSGWKKGQLILNDNPVVFDNCFYFSFEVKSNLLLSAVVGNVATDYINTVFQTDNFFQLKLFPEQNINYAVLNNSSVVIINEVKTLSTGLAQQLKKYVEQGGTLLFFPSFDADLVTYRDFLQSLSVDYPEQIVNEETTIQTLHLKDPIFNDMFEYLPQKAEMPVTKKYFTFSNQTQTRKQNLLELPQHKTFFARYTHQKGTIYMAAIPLNDEVSNFAKHAIFLPLMYRIALLSMNGYPLYYQIGGTNRLETVHCSAAPDQTLKIIKDASDGGGRSVAGQVEFIPELRQNEHNTTLYIDDQIKESGNYRLLKGDSTLALFAFNAKNQESNLKYSTNNAIESVFPHQNVKLIESDKNSMKNIVQSLDNQTQLWKLFLMLTLLFILTEILLIRFFGKPISFFLSEKKLDS